MLPCCSAPVARARGSRPLGPLLPGAAACGGPGTRGPAAHGHGSRVSGPSRPGSPGAPPAQLGELAPWPVRGVVTPGMQRARGSIPTPSAPPRRRIGRAARPRQLLAQALKNEGRQPGHHLSRPTFAATMLRPIPFCFLRVTVITSGSFLRG